MSTPVVNWDDPAIDALLRRLWDEGLSCSQIAQKIRGATRNGVIGRARRIDLPGRKEPAQPKSAPPKKKRPTKSPVAHNPPEIVDLEPEPKPYVLGSKAPIGRLTVVQMPLLGRCRFPVDGEGADTLMCGEPSGESTYCKPHAERAYNPKPLKRIKV